tara:strand:+ start:291 stop:626 length:336 start_codon:yes stop_codon:yes gene_type:complete
MKKLTKERKKELVKLLKSYFKKDSTAFCSLKSVSNSGMYRHIQILGTHKNNIHNLSYYVAELCGFTFKDKTCSVGVSGCGMDMGFHIVNTLSHYLYSNQERGEYYINHRWI